MSKNHWALLLLATTGSNVLFAQVSKDSTGKQLDQVVVTATKYPVKQQLTGKVLNIITREQLEKNQGRQLTEILNDQAGLVIIGSQNVLGTNQTVFMQGA